MKRFYVASISDSSLIGLRGINKFNMFDTPQAAITAASEHLQKTPLLEKIYIMEAAIVVERDRVPVKVTTYAESKGPTQNYSERDGYWKNESPKAPQDEKRCFNSFKGADLDLD